VSSSEIAVPTTADGSDVLTSSASTSTPDAVDGEATGRLRPLVYRQHQRLSVLAFGAVLSFAPLVLHSGYAYDLVNRSLIMALVTVGFYLAFALGGQFAFSQASFMALGAYVSGRIGMEHPVLLGFVAAIAAGVVLGAVFALAMRRANQFFFAIGTLAIGELILILAVRWTDFTGLSGQMHGVARLEAFGKVFRTDTEVFYVLLAVLVAGLFLSALIVRSPLRRDAIANRDNAFIGRTLGVPILRTRVVMFALGTGYAAAAGALFAHVNGFVTTDAFGVDVGVQIFLMAIVGGLGSHWGAVAGAFFVIYVGEALRSASEWKGLVYGALLVIVMIVLPEGLSGVVHAARNSWRKIRRAPAR
jgi:branched-chain amino acid transport system permease protein